MLMAYDNEQFRELMPAYLAGELTGGEREEFEQMLADDKELRQELEELRDLQAYYQQLKDGSPSPAPELFSRVEQQIGSEKVEPTEIVDSFKFGSFLRFLFGQPALAWGVVAVQCLFIFGLLWLPPSEVRFQTLSVPQTTAPNRARINLVFTEKINEAEIRRLLLQVEAEIVAGPSIQGRYLIAVSAEQDLKQVVSILQSSPLVKVAESAL